MKKTVYLLQETSDNHQTYGTIAIIDDKELASAMMRDYYGDYLILNERQIDDSGLVWEKEIDTKDIDGDISPVRVFLTEYRLNEV